jgi:hypothetical protein
MPSFFRCKSRHSYARNKRRFLCLARWHKKRSRQNRNARKISTDHVLSRKLFRTALRENSQSLVHFFRTRQRAKFPQALFKKLPILVYLSWLFVMDTDYGVPCKNWNPSATMLFHFVLLVPIRRISRAAGKPTDSRCHAEK